MVVFNINFFLLYFMQHYLVKSWLNHFGYCIFLRSALINTRPPKVSSLVDRMSTNVLSTISKTVLGYGSNIICYKEINSATSCCTLLGFNFSQLCLDQIQSSAVLTRSNITWHCIHHWSDWAKVWTRVWAHKIHPIPRPNGPAMGCILWEFRRRLTVL